MKSGILCRILILLVILVLPLDVAAAMESFSYRIKTQVISSGGALMQSVSYQMNSTLGQSTSHMSGDQVASSTNYRLYPGFWYTTNLNTVSNRLAMPWIPLLLLDD